jgi:hypothetical protein
MRVASAARACHEFRGRPLFAFSSSAREVMI